MRRKTLQGRVLDATETTAQVYTDEASAYRGIARKHDTVHRPRSCGGWDIL